MLFQFKHVGPLRSSLVASILIFLAAFIPRAAAEEFPSETNLLVDTYPDEIGTGEQRPVQCIGINYENFEWTAQTAHVAVLKDPANLLHTNRIDMPPGVTTGYIRQWCFTTTLTAPMTPQVCPLELQMAKSTGETFGLKLSLSITVKSTGRLVAENLSLTPRTLNPVDPVTASFTIRNTSTQASLPQLWQLWASADPLFWSTRDLAHFGWQRAVVGATLPPPCQEAAMAYDARRARTVLFGGANDTTFFGETWEYAAPEVSGTPGWRRVATSGPAPRAGHSMVYDAARGKVVLFGGQDGSGYLADTWEYSPEAGWVRLATTGPAPRGRAAMVYDSKRAKVILFGGATDTALFDDTWEHTPGVGWKDVSGSVRPAPRIDCGAAYDSSRGRFIIFGGRGYGQVGDMWQYTPAAGWAQLDSTGISPHEGHVLFYDPKRDRVVLFGGSDFDYRGESWEWRDGRPWQLIPTLGPTTRSRMGSAYDSARGKLLIYGGWDSYYLGDTWELLCGGNDIYLGAQTLPTLAPGQSKSYQITLDPKTLGVPAALTPGAYNVGLIPDAHSQATTETHPASVYSFPQTLLVKDRNAVRGWEKYE